MAVFLFFVMQVRSQETLDTATSPETTESVTTAETAQVTDTATSTELTEETAQTTETNQTNGTVGTKPVTNEETALATSTPLEREPINSSINSISPKFTTASSSPIKVEELLPSAQASSSLVTNGTSTEPIPPPLPEKELILQPSVDLKTDGDAVNARIGFHNLSCRSCGKQLPDTDVIAYYTPWYPNDGEIKEIGSRMGEESFRVANLANWGEYKADWSRQVPPGHYYFVVITDPDNLNNLYDMYRAEFAISS